MAVDPENLLATDPQLPSPSSAGTGPRRQQLAADTPGLAWWRGFLGLGAAALLMAGLHVWLSAGIWISAAVAFLGVAGLSWLRSGFLRGSAEVGETGSAQYIALPAAEKIRALWAKACADATSMPFPSLIGVLAGVLDTDLSQMQCHVSDELPADHHLKVIHCQGVLAQMEWVSSADHDYTGMFRGGQGFVRFSVGAQADYTCECEGDGTGPSPSGFLPGGSFKLMRDGTHSANFVTLPPNGANGQMSYNFFRQPWFTHVGAPCIAVLKDKFGTSSPLVNMVGLKDFAVTDRAGVREVTPNFPYQLRISPDESVATRFSDTGPTCTQDVLDQLCTLTAGETTSVVHAQRDPGAPWVRIGHIVLSTAPVTSRWADERMFFRHGQFMDDLQDHPDWIPHLPSVYGKTKMFKTCPATAQHDMYEQVCAAARG